MHPDCIGLSKLTVVKAVPVPGASPRRVPRADQRHRSRAGSQGLPGLQGLQGQQGSFRLGARGPGASTRAQTANSLTQEVPYILKWTNCAKELRAQEERRRGDDRMPPSRHYVPKGPPRTRKYAGSLCRLGLIALGLVLFDHRAMCLMSNSVDDWVSGSAVVCNGIPGLTKEQRELCHRNPDVTVAALKGLQMAVKECQHQFTWHRWNCSSLTASSRNQQSSVLLQRGYRETAFAYAISAAGVAHSVARACSMGRLLSCGCDPSSYRGRPPAKARGTQWKWGGCSHNLEYGMEFSKQFLDSREKAGDIQSTVNLHNNHAGRLAVATNMQVRCKCHGMSGSCELKTCWKVTPDFRIVGKTLKDRFRSAILVAQSNLGNVTPLTRVRGSRRRRPDRQRQRKHRGGGGGGGAGGGGGGGSGVISGTERGGRKRKPRDLAKQLFYYQKSPNFCERDPTIDIPGTAGRRCNRTSPGGDGCASLCCGRGYNVVRQRRTERCHCKFHWCCFVQCQNCTVEEWITVCK